MSLTGSWSARSWHPERLGDPKCSDSGLNGGRRLERDDAQSMKQVSAQQANYHWALPKRFSDPKLQSISKYICLS